MNKGLIFSCNSSNGAASRPSRGNAGGMRGPGVALFDTGRGLHLASRMAGINSKWLVAVALGKQAASINPIQDIGSDLAARCLNGLVTCGATPLFFVPYFEHQDEEVVYALHSGSIDACLAASCPISAPGRPRSPARSLALKNASFPSDVAIDADSKPGIFGTATGVVRADQVFDPRSIAAGDVLVGLPTKAVHSSHFGFVLSIMALEGLTVSDPFPGLSDSTALGEILLAPSTVYVKQVLEMSRAGKIKAVVHTQGGLRTSLEEILPSGLKAMLDFTSLKIPPILEFIQQAKNLQLDDMVDKFNMGNEMVIVTDVQTACLFEAPVIGEIVKSA